MKFVLINNDFSRNCTLNHVRIGNKKCEIKSCSNRIITCIAPSAYKKHFINNSIFEPSFGNGFSWSETHLKINRGDYVEWSWNSPDILMRLSYKVEQVESFNSTKNIGFTSGKPTSKGSFVFQFNTPGIFHYWSGYINFQKYSLRGIIEVLDFSDKKLDIDVLTNGFKGDNFYLCNQNKSIFIICNFSLKKSTHYEIKKSWREKIC
jgi:hypothetical protein